MELFLGMLGSAELLVIFVMILGLPSLVMFLIALIQCLSAKFHEPTNKIVWVVLILLAPFIGPILWWTIGMKQRRFD